MVFSREECEENDKSYLQVYATMKSRELISSNVKTEKSFNWASCSTTYSPYLMSMPGFSELCVCAVAIESRMVDERRASPFVSFACYRFSSNKFFL